MKDPVSLCADAVAAWHDSWLTALGLHSETDGEVWRALEPPPFIYFAGITLRPNVPETSVASAPGSICDAWQTLDLKPLGFKVWRQEPWFLRPAGPVSDEMPPELAIVRVATAAEVEELELVSARGFGSENATIEPGLIHPPTVLDDPAMALFLARVDGKPVGAAMGYRRNDAVGVFGVTTIASARGRGYGTALTGAAMLPETGLPSILAPSEEGERMYQRLGYRSVGALSIWVREDQGP